MRRDINVTQYILQVRTWYKRTGERKERKDQRKIKKKRKKDKRKMKKARQEEVTTQQNKVYKELLKQKRGK